MVEGQISVLVAALIGVAVSIFYAERERRRSDRVMQIADGAMLKLRKLDMLMSGNIISPEARIDRARAILAGHE